MNMPIIIHNLGVSPRCGSGMFLCTLLEVLRREVTELPPCSLYRDAGVVATPGALYFPGVH